MWSISPAPPAGLTFSTTDGSIGGTPAAIAAAATYVVTAQNSGGVSTVSLTLGVADVLLNLVHTTGFDVLRLSGSRMLSVDGLHHWELWNYGTGARVASGDVPCTATLCGGAGGSPPVPIRGDLLGATVVLETANGLEVRSSMDGSMLATLSAGTLATVGARDTRWWKLASDGSYVCAFGSSSLTVWSATGAVIASRAGDYQHAQVFAAPGEVRIAAGPAGSSVIETMSLPTGTASVSPAYLGTFQSWFTDGERFITGTGTAVWIYSKTGVQQDAKVFGSPVSVTGQGSWFWTGNGSVIVYQVGSSVSPSAAVYAPTGSTLSAVPSGLTIGVTFEDHALYAVIDLSGPSPSVASSPPVPGHFYFPRNGASSNEFYAGIAGSQWVVGNPWGVLIDGASLGGTPRYFGLGAALSIAGSEVGRVVIATASGKTFFLDAATKTLEGTIDFFSVHVALSSDGTVLAAPDAGWDGTGYNTRIYSLPSGTLTYSDPPPPTATVDDLTLSGSGAVLGEVLGGSQLVGRQVIPISGGQAIWSDGDRYDPIRLSPDGTLIAVSNARYDTAATIIYKNGTQVALVPGWAFTWLDNSRLLVNNYAGNTYSKSTIFDSSGALLSSPSLLALGYVSNVQVVGPDSVYDQASNAIYSVTAGNPTWSGPPALGIGAVAGPRVAFASGDHVLTEAY
jgi:hypothetical protein